MNVAMLLPETGLSRVPMPSSGPPRVSSPWDVHATLGSAIPEYRTQRDCPSGMGRSAHLRSRQKSIRSVRLGPVHATAATIGRFAGTMVTREQERETTKDVGYEYRVTEPTHAHPQGSPTGANRKGNPGRSAPENEPIHGFGSSAGAAGEPTLSAGAACGRNGFLGKDLRHAGHRRGRSQGPTEGPAGGRS